MFESFSTDAAVTVATIAPVLLLTLIVEVRRSSHRKENVHPAHLDSWKRSETLGTVIRILAAFSTLTCVFGMVLVMNQGGSTGGADELINPPLAWILAGTGVVIPMITVLLAAAQPSRDA